MVQYHFTRILLEKKKSKKLKFLVRLRQKAEKVKPGQSWLTSNVCNKWWLMWTKLEGVYKRL